MFGQVNVPGKAYNTKQDKLKGKKGQLVGFDETGNAIAQEAPDTGVVTFNGRAGGVAAQKGDYTPEQVGALPADGTAVSARKLESARSVITDLSNANSVDFDGTSSIKPGVTGVLPVGNGGNGNPDGIAPSAERLKTPRSIQTNLSSNMPENFDGTRNINPGITGKLGIGNGGTNAATAQTAMWNLMKDNAELTNANLSETDIIPVGDTSTSTAKKATLLSLANFFGSIASAVKAAAKLANARTFRVNLSSTKAVSFDGTANVEPGVKGTLGVNCGGTGATNAPAARNNIGAAPTANPVFTGSISMGRKSESTVGNNSVTEGEDAEASGNGSHAEGCSATASGRFSHAEGNITTASGNYSHAEGYCAKASGESSHAEGCSAIASGKYSHAEGYFTEASGEYSHAEGYHTTKALGNGSHAEGHYVTASGEYSHAEGDHTTASNYASHACGKYNKSMTDGGTPYGTDGDAMVIGNGNEDFPSNCFRVTYAGAVYGLSAFNSTGADYAEYFEWADGNPDGVDRVGYFVTMEGDKIRIARPGDYILGIVSGQPCIIGNADEDWLDRWEHDEFGRFIRENIDTPVIKYKEVLNENGNPTGKMQEIETGEVIHGWGYKPNPDYDPSQQYVERKDRKEWSAVGMVGVLSVWDDGTCKVNGFCKVAEGGIAAAANKEMYIQNEEVLKAYRVIERISDNVVKIVFK